MRKSHFLYTLVVVAIAGVLVFWAAKSYWDYLLSPADSQDSQVQVFIISKGDASADIADRLQQKGLIRSALAFRLFARFSGRAAQIQAGSFRLSPSMSADQMLRELAVGAEDKWVTLLEGWRVEEMAAQLSKDLGIDKKEFLTRVREGYVFPDTYLFSKDGGVAEVIKATQDNFNKKYDKALQQMVEAKGLTTDQGVILASIVEREARTPQARQMVASILLKRLRIGMALNTDATIQYALGYQHDEKSWWKKNLTDADKQVDSLYNTYTHAGLPPGPICNPGLSSLEAVANADPSTPFLYYYHDSNGVPHYARTLDEQNQNVANYP